MEKDNICKFNKIYSGDLFCADIVFETTSIHSKPTCAEKHLIGIVSDGTGEVIKDSERHVLSRGSIFFIEKSEKFVINGDGLKYFYITFHGRRANELIERITPVKEFPTPDKEKTNRLIHFGFECLECEENLDLLAESILLYALSQLNSGKKQTNTLLSQIITLTHDNFSQSSFSLSTLADTLGYNAKYLSSFFSKNKNIRYSDYLKQLRVRHAIFLMEQGISSIKSIAYLSGFSDALYFSKVFKSEIGSSPKDYINSLQKI